MPENNIPNLDNTQFKEQVVKLIKEEIRKSLGFSQRKLGDTPTDDKMYTPRSYVNMYGSIAGRPISSVVGQQYFATDLGYPIYKSNNGAWVNGVGSVIG